MNSKEAFWLNLAQSISSMPLHEIKQAVFEEYRKRTLLVKDDISQLSVEEMKDYSRWLNKAVEEGAGSIYYKRESVLVPNISSSLSSKIITLGQYHCPLCKGDNFPVTITPIRVSPESYQYLKKRRGDYVGAFKKAIKASLDTFNSHQFGSEQRLCVHIVFVLSKNAVDKEVDNMTKITLDALKNNKFGDDKMIDHLSTLKIRTKSDEGWIIVNIRPTGINNHSDVFIELVNHIFSEPTTRRIEDYL
jgi:hypothetical protein